MEADDDLDELVLDDTLTEEMRASDYIDTAEKITIAQREDPRLTPALLYTHPDCSAFFWMLRLSLLYHAPSDHWIIKYALPLGMLCMLLAPLVALPLTLLLAWENQSNSTGLPVLTAFFFYGIPPAIFIFAYCYFLTRHFESFLCLSVHGGVASDLRRIMKRHVIGSFIVILLLWSMSIVSFFSGAAANFTLGVTGVMVVPLYAVFALLGLVTFNVVVLPISTSSIVMGLLAAEVRAYTKQIRSRELNLSEARRRHHTLHAHVAAVGREWQNIYMVAGALGVIGLLLGFYSLFYSTDEVLRAGSGNIGYGTFLIFAVFLPLLLYASYLPASVTAACDEVVTAAASYFSSYEGKDVEHVSFVLQVVHNRAAFRIYGMVVTWTFIAQVAFVVLSGLMFILQNKVGQVVF